VGACRTRDAGPCQSVLVVIDVQEAYRGRTVEHARMVRGVRRLIEAAKVIGVQMLATDSIRKVSGISCRKWPRVTRRVA